MDLAVRTQAYKEMASTLWAKSLEEVVANPYDWSSYHSFIKESQQLLNILFPLLERHVLKYNKNDRSCDKALWMLMNDGLDTLRDCVFLMEYQKHRLVGKMFRHLVEVMDLACYFRANTTNSTNDLQRWYNDEIIPHRRYRDYLAKYLSQEKAKQSKDDHSNFSRWTHHTYRTLLNSYSLGRDDLMVYDSHSPHTLTLPTTLSQYLWALGTFISDYLRILELLGIATETEVENAKIVAGVII